MIVTKSGVFNKVKLKLKSKAEEMKTFLLFDEKGSHQGNRQLYEETTTVLLLRVQWIMICLSVIFLLRRRQ